MEPTIFPHSLNAKNLQRSQICFMVAHSNVVKFPLVVTIFMPWMVTENHSLTNFTMMLRSHLRDFFKKSKICYSDTKIVLVLLKVEVTSCHFDNKVLVVLT